LTNVWLNKLGQSATSAEAREQHSQLGAVLDYFGKEHRSTKKEEIDWDSFREDIHTEGVVDKIKAKYDGFMESEYHVDGAISKVGTQNEQIAKLDVLMNYNYELWHFHYIKHL